MIFFQYLGLIICALILVIVMYGLYRVGYETIDDKLRQKYAGECSDRIAGSLETAAHWFCEDKQTAELINDIAYQVKEYRFIFPDVLRNKWRERKAKSSINKDVGNTR